MRATLSLGVILLAVSYPLLAQQAAAPIHNGKNISELRDTFWRLKQVEGSTQDVSQILSHIVIDIEQNRITFSEPCYVFHITFEYRQQTGLKFFTPYAEGGSTKGGTCIEDHGVANLFEDALHKSSSYELNKDSLTFFESDQHPIAVLSALHPKGIEDRWWRIAKYRVDNSDRADKDGLIDAAEPAWVLFMNGNVSGTPGAGMWAGSYKLSGDDLEFDAGDPGYAYSGAFREEQAVQDSLVCKAFKGDLRIEQKGDQILLRDKRGQAQILLVPF